MGDANSKKKEMIKESLDEICQRVLKKGFYGKVVFTLNVQDGVIQDVERSEIKKYK